MKTILAAALTLACAACASAPQPTYTAFDHSAINNPVFDDDGRPPSYGDRSGERRQRAERPSGPRNEFSFYIGGRQLEDDSLWDPNDEQFVFGIESVIGIIEGFGLELGLISAYSDEDENGPDSEFLSLEGSFGLRYAHDFGRIVPYVGAGVAGVIVYQEIGSNDFDDETLAGYVHGGVQFEATDFFAVGLDFRHLFDSEINRFGSPVESDVDYGQLALRLSFIF